jgi:hypothetical protein
MRHSGRRALFGRPPITRLQDVRVVEGTRVSPRTRTPRLRPCDEPIP